MPVKVKRGLGLLAVATLAALLFAATQGASNTGAQLVALVAGLGMVAALVGGLALLAWGLLLD